jgi:hypothetical protein
MPKTKHGMFGTRIYRIYQGIKRRCNNPNASDYKYYGGRGITVCEEWNEKDGFVAFYKWAVENGYADNLTIDRIDVSKGYSPNNCRWVTQVEQARNKRNNHKVVFDGKEMCLSEVSQITKLKNTTLRERIKRKGRLDTSPIYRLCTDYDGEQVTLKELSEITGIGYSTLQNRLYKGYKGKDIYADSLVHKEKTTIQFDKNGVEIARFKSAKEASEKTGVKKSCVIMACLGKRKTGGGFIWRYLDDM